MRWILTSLAVVAPRGAAGLGGSGGQAEHGEQGANRLKAMTSAVERLRRRRRPTLRSPTWATLGRNWTRRRSRPLRLRRPAWNRRLERVADRHPDGPGRMAGSAMSVGAARPTTTLSPRVAPSTLRPVVTA